MLKLNASFSKKVPADQQYSSQSYHAAVEVEIPDGLTHDQLQERIRETFALVRSSVEQEIASVTGAPVSAISAAPVSTAPVQAPAPASTASTKLGSQASQKQIKFLLDIARRQGIDLAVLQHRLRSAYGLSDVYDLSKKQCSQMIDLLQSQAA